ncbi:MAG: tetratricopeptide repeat protein, partial [Deltaproteobacteria bacterium]|nr:tetratricopeptide repeat protein [Deltaproteobacteria bacterium]
LVLGKLGRYEESLNAFQKAGDKASAYNNLGCVYLAQKKYQQALTAFQKAIEINPKHYEKARENIAHAEASIKAEHAGKQQ